ncbi:MAG: homoserine dehydrogenase [Chloroflexi bacterium]|nr:homoserine dehydrogenase [Chloroflexota bacterium]
MIHPVRVALVGLGNVGRAFLDLMISKADVLADRYGLSLVLTGAADSSGAVMDAAGIDPMALASHKARGGNAGNFLIGVPGMHACKLVAQVEADLLLEASPVNLQTGQPGLDCVRTAIGRGMGVVLANKGPLVHAFGELTAAAAAAGVGLAYSATVCGALPVVNIGQRDLGACDIRSVAGIFNATSNSILAAMARGGSYEQALRQAQLDGVAEADPSLDVEGWDTANKLVIIANSILRQPATLADVQPVVGITSITAEQIRAGAAQGQVVKLVARAERTEDAPDLTGPEDLSGLSRYRLSVQPAWLPTDDFLASVSGWEMGIVFDTDIMGLQQLKVDERGPLPTAAAMLRDVINMIGDK